MKKTPEFRILVNSEAEHDKAKRLLSKHFRTSDSGDDFLYTGSPMYVKYAECINTLWSSKVDGDDGCLYNSLKGFLEVWPEFNEANNPTMAHAEELVREVRSLKEMQEDFEAFKANLANKEYRVAELKEILGIKG